MIDHYRHDVLNALASLVQELANTEYTHGLLAATGRNTATKKNDITRL